MHRSRKVLKFYPNSDTIDLLLEAGADVNAVLEYMYGANECKSVLFVALKSDNLTRKHSIVSEVWGSN